MSVLAGARVKTLMKTPTSMWPPCFHALPFAQVILISILGEGAMPLFWASQLVNDRTRPTAEVWQSVLGPVPSCRFALVSQPTATPLRPQCGLPASTGPRWISSPLCFPCKNGPAGGGRKLLSLNRWGCEGQGQGGNSG